jgi:biotin carboxyl carrier protein
LDLQYRVGNEVKSIRVEPAGAEYRVSIGDREYRARIICARSSEVTFVVDGQRHTAHVAENGSTRYISIDGEAVTLSQATAAQSRRRRAVGGGSLEASMPGQVAKVLVAQGDLVERGQTLVVLEAMKMEIKVTAPSTGRVAKVHVKPGQVVERGQGLIELATDEM